MDDPGLSLRFKYGPQTIFLFVERNDNFKTISAKLFDVLRQTYPRGLVSSKAHPEDGVLAIPRPEDEADFHVSYAIPRNPRDLHAGWNRLNVTAASTPSSLRLRENTALAFCVQPAMEETAPSFMVDVFSPAEDYDDEQ